MKVYPLLPSTHAQVSESHSGKAYSVSHMVESDRDAILVGGVVIAAVAVAADIASVRGIAATRRGRPPVAPENTIIQRITYSNRSGSPCPDTI